MNDVVSLPKDDTYGSLWADSMRISLILGSDEQFHRYSDTDRYLSPIAVTFVIDMSIILNNHN